MNKLARIAIVLALGSIIANPLSVQGFNTNIDFFTEVGDAGNTPGTAQLITGGPYDGILGSKNDINDTADYYAFVWGGGDFNATFTSNLDPELILLTSSQALVAGAFGTAPLSLTPVIGLAPGNYIIGVSGIPTPGTYAILFETPISGAVPEPASGILILIGLAATYLARVNHARQ